MFSKSFHSTEPVVALMSELKLSDVVVKEEPGVCRHTAPALVSGLVGTLKSVYTYCGPDSVLDHSTGDAELPPSYTLRTLSEGCSPYTSMVSMAEAGDPASTDSPLVWRTEEITRPWTSYKTMLIGAVAAEICTTSTNANPVGVAVGVVVGDAVVVGTTGEPLRSKMHLLLTQMVPLLQQSLLALHVETVFAGWLEFALDVQPGVTT
jgi:hypothetical protein